MTPSTRHALRLAMRTFYTATGFLSAMLAALVAHDGIAADGYMLPAQTKYLVGAAVFWAIAVVLDGFTGEPVRRGR